MIRHTGPDVSVLVDDPDAPCPAAPHVYLLFAVVAVNIALLFLFLVST